MNGLSNEKIMDVCQKIDMLLKEEGVEMPDAFNVIGTWICGTTLTAVAHHPDRRPEVDVYRFLESIRYQISSQADKARGVQLPDYMYN